MWLSIIAWILLTFIRSHCNINESVNYYRIIQLRKVKEKKIITKGEGKLDTTQVYKNSKFDLTFALIVSFESIQLLF